MASTDVHRLITSLRAGEQFTVISDVVSRTQVHSPSLIYSYSIIKGHRMWTFTTSIATFLLFFFQAFPEFCNLVSLLLAVRNKQFSLYLHDVVVVLLVGQSEPLRRFRQPISDGPLRD